MTKQELKKLRRKELLEMLLELSKENAQLRNQLAEARRRLQKRDIRLREAGSIAEAALRLNGVFEAAQAAADQYVDTIKKRTEGSLP